MTINVSVQINGGLLPDIILFTLPMRLELHWETLLISCRLEFLSLQPIMFPPVNLLTDCNV